MSLGVYLILKDTPKKPSSGIFIRENGTIKEISEDEWRRRYPTKEPVKMNVSEATGIVYQGNITHNLGKMATVSGLYEACWVPESLGITIAKDLKFALTLGLEELKSDPEKYKKFNPENGWGKYEDLVSFVEGYIDGCTLYPEAKVEVSR